jgi:hypothetical protein
MKVMRRMIKMPDFERPDNNCIIYENNCSKCPYNNPFNDVLTLSKKDWEERLRKMSKELQLENRMKKRKEILEQIKEYEFALSIADQKGLDAGELEYQVYRYGGYIDALKWVLNEN